MNWSLPIFSMANPMSDEEMEKAMEKMGRLQDAIDAADG